MKIVYFTTYYEPYLVSFYEKNPNLANQPYQIQLQALIDDAFGSFCSYITEINQQENNKHKAHLIIPNAKPLQMAWAKENNVIFDENNWKFSIPILQTKKIEPDVFYMASVFEYYGEFLDEIKKYSKKIFGWISCPLPNNIFQKTYPELILSSAPHYVEDFRKQGINSELLTVFFDENVLNTLQKKYENTKIAPQKYDFTFLGGITQSHKSRIEAINKLVKKTPIQLFGYGFEHFPDTRNRIIRKLFKHPVQKRYQGEAWGLDMYQILQNSKITFNIHIDIANGFGVNMRMYEATGMGTLLLTDGKGKNQLFADNEVVYYENLDDAIEKAHYYLHPKNENERLKIAQAGQKRTLENYNTKNIVKNMLEHFEKYL